MPARAVVVANLYNVELQVTDQSTGTRNAAFADALSEVLVRTSGNSAVHEQLRITSASAYVQQFQYREIDTAALDDGDGSQASRYRMQVQFNPGKVIELLRANAQPVWSAHRNEAVVWLAVRDGANRYIIKSNDVSALKTSVETVASRRALPLLWPTYDSRDQQALTFADVWAAFATPVKSASERYSDGPVIIGRLAWNGKQWTGEWSVFVEQSSRGWVLADADYDSLIARAMDLVTDEIGSHYAVLDAPLGENAPDLLVEVEQVNSIADFRRLSLYIERLPVVKAAQAISMDASGRVVFAVSLRSRPADFEKLVTVEKLLKKVVFTDPVQQPGAGQNTLQTSRLHYRYQP